MNVRSYIETLVGRRTPTVNVAGYAHHADSTTPAGDAGYAHRAALTRRGLERVAIVERGRARWARAVAEAERACAYWDWYDATEGQADEGAMLTVMLGAEVVVDDGDTVPHPDYAESTDVIDPALVDHDDMLHAAERVVHEHLDAVEAEHFEHQALRVTNDWLGTDMLTEDERLQAERTMA